MADGLENLPERVEAVEGKLEGLAASVETRFDHVDRRFDQVDRRFDQVDQRFDLVDQRFDQVEAALIEQRRCSSVSGERFHPSGLPNRSTLMRLSASSAESPCSTSQQPATVPVRPIPPQQ